MKSWIQNLPYRSKLLESTEEHWQVTLQPDYQTILRTLYQIHIFASLKSIQIHIIEWAGVEKCCRISWIHDRGSPLRPTLMCLPLILHATNLALIPNRHWNGQCHFCKDKLSLVTDLQKTQGRTNKECQHWYRHIKIAISHALVSESIPYRQ